MPLVDERLPWKTVFVNVDVPERSVKRPPPSVDAVLHATIALLKDPDAPDRFTPPPSVASFSDTVPCSNEKFEPSSAYTPPPWSAKLPSMNVPTNDALLFRRQMPPP